MGCCTFTIHKIIVQVCTVLRYGMFMYNMYLIPRYMVCACTVDCTQEPVIYHFFLKEKKDQVKSCPLVLPVSSGTCQLGMGQIDVHFLSQYNGQQEQIHQYMEFAKVG